MEYNSYDSLAEKINGLLYNINPNFYNSIYETPVQGFIVIKSFFENKEPEKLLEYLHSFSRDLPAELMSQYEDIVDSLNEYISTDEKERLNERAVESINDRPIVKLTNQPISDALDSVLKRLENYEEVDLDEIMEVPEMVLAESIVAEGKSTHQLQGRNELRQKILGELLSRGSISGIDTSGEMQYNNNVRRGNRLDIVIGLPASGKSSALVNTLAEEYGSRIVDNDEAKKLFPEYNNGWGATLVHKESKMVSDCEFEVALDRGENIVLPKVGADAQKLLVSYVSKALKKNYSVNVHYVTLARSKALSRMLLRFVEEGRFLSPALIESYSPAHELNRITQTFDALIGNADIASKTMWSNDVERGEKPVLLFNDGATGTFIDTARQPSKDWLEKFPINIGGKADARKEMLNLMNEVAYASDPYGYADSLDSTYETVDEEKAIGLSLLEKQYEKTSIKDAAKDFLDKYAGEDALEVMDSESLKNVAKIREFYDSNLASEEKQSVQKKSHEKATSDIPKKATKKPSVLENLRAKANELEQLHAKETEQKERDTDIGKTSPKSKHKEEER